MKAAQIDQLRDKFNAWQRRQEIAYANRTGSWSGASYAGKPLRFNIFLQRLERAERARVRFASHLERVQAALASPAFALEEAA